LQRRRRQRCDAGRPPGMPMVLPTLHRGARDRRRAGPPRASPCPSHRYRSREAHSAVRQLRRPDARQMIERRFRHAVCAPAWIRIRRRVRAHVHHEPLRAQQHVADDGLAEPERPQQVHLQHAREVPPLTVRGVPCARGLFAPQTTSPLTARGALHGVVCTQATVAPVRCARGSAEARASMAGLGGGVGAAGFWGIVAIRSPAGARARSVARAYDLA